MSTLPARLARHWRRLPAIAWQRMRFAAARAGLPLTDNERRLAGLKGIHTGRRAFVIGNGPSLRMDDLDAIRDELSFAANRIYLAFAHTSWRPTYLAAEDPLMVAGCSKELMALGIPSFFPEDLRAALPRAALTSDTVHFLPYFRPAVPNFSRDALRRVYWGGSVIHGLLQLAWFMGIRELYLLGMDHEFSIPGSNAEPQDVVHEAGEQNHFHPGYRNQGEAWFPPDTAWQEASYACARKVFEEEGGDIYNATRGGRLEVFKRRDFDALPEIGI